MILIDTSAFFAVLNARDINNPQATKVWQTILNEDIPIFCNNYVLLETLALLQNRMGIIAAQDFHENIRPFLQIEWVTEKEHNYAMLLLLSANRRHLSLVDLSAFATMRRLEITKAFTFDHHFAEQGFQVLPTWQPAN